MKGFQRNASGSFINSASFLLYQPCYRSESDLTTYRFAIFTTITNMTIQTTEGFSLA
jgi:hypothetical protein